MSFLSGLRDTIDKHKDLPKLREGFTRTFAEVRGRINPNHRHDDPDEIERDKIRAEICASHRFGSFAPERQGHTVKWYIDGHDYFWAVSELLESAKECIFILDWWLSPELYLRRPPADFPQYRIDRLLKRKAEQGVKIYVIVYKEVTQTMNMSSRHTKNALTELHPNVSVLRHPDHIGTDSSALFWSHHEKVIVVDNHRACIGGLDACFGRWDTHNHPLADVHPTDFTRTLFPGQDYNNGRVLDFQQVDNYASNQVSLLEVARMPWHDVHMSFMGPAVLDVVQHFVERWNEVKTRKYPNDPKYDWLALPHPITGPNETEDRHPHREAWHEMGHKFKSRWHKYAGDRDDRDEDDNEDSDDDDVRGYGGRYTTQRGTCNAQVLRSVSDWSHGVLPEHSIQNAYIQMIREANHFIYIENQFFISSTKDGDPVTNKIAAALVERILQAAKEGRKFRVMVILPEVPGFAGDIEKETSIKTIMAGQWRTMNRGGNSIYELIRAAGYNPLDYIRFYHLRSYDRINAPASFIQEMERRSGVSYYEAQVALARTWIGDDGFWHQDKVKIKKPSVSWGGDEETFGTTEKKTTEEVPSVDFPASTAEAQAIVDRFQSAAPRDDSAVSDSIAQHTLQDRTSLQQEQWLGSEEEERDCIVTELLYIHSKLMIVDDRRVIMGSANINDRSQKGDGDSEIALVVEDKDMISTTMDGRPYMAARFAATLRRKLFREHLGLIPPQNCITGREPVTSFMRAPPVPHEEEIGTQDDNAVADPLSDELWSTWNWTAHQNRGIFSELFKTVPCDNVRNWSQYKGYVPKVRTGHLATDLPLYEVKNKLSQIRGSLVECPLDFLIEEKSLVDNPDWKGLNPSLPVYI